MDASTTEPVAGFGNGLLSMGDERHSRNSMHPAFSCALSAGVLSAERVVDNDDEVLAPD